MNYRMWENPIVRENVEKLKKYGSGFIGPAEGRLAESTGWEDWQKSRISLIL